MNVYQYHTSSSTRSNPFSYGHRGKEESSKKQVIREVRKVTASGTDDAIQSGFGSSGKYVSSRRSGSLRGSGRITRKTVLGDKFDYGEKIKEKRNYILYVSGTGREKKEIEEIEEPQAQEEYVEEKQLIDNYKYKETKNLKNRNPNRFSETHHKRLNTPFERTTLKKYVFNSSGVPIHSYTTNDFNKTRLGAIPSYNRSTEVYENYESVKPSSTSQTYLTSYGNRTVSTGNKGLRSQNKFYQSKYGNTVSTTNTEISRQKKRGYPYQQFSNTTEIYKYQRPVETEVYKERFRVGNPFNFSSEGKTKTETKKDGKFVRVTSTKKAFNTGNQNVVSGSSGYVSKTTVTKLRGGRPSGDNYNYYESKNVKKYGRLNKPVTQHLRRREGETYNYSSQGKSYSYTKNLRSAGQSSNKKYGQSGYEEYTKYEQRGTKGGIRCACGQMNCGGFYH